MRKIIGRPEHYVDDALNGILAAHPGYLTPIGDDLRALIRTGSRQAATVGLVSGGGFGHLPLFLGYVGDGLLDGVAVGNVFASPSAETMMKVIRSADAGEGVVAIIGNYTGDALNFGIAAEMAKDEGIHLEIVRVTDDVASAPMERAADRRGIAGLSFAAKVAGALARRGVSQLELVNELQNILNGLRSMGVAMGPCILPEVGRPLFDISVGTMEIGMGIHGEPGVHRAAVGSADSIAQELVGRILADFGDDAPNQVAVLINGLGATSVEELYLLYGAVHEILTRSQVKVERAYVGEFSTSMEMAGASVSILRVTERICGLLDEPISSPLLSLWHRSKEA